jgi:hypothetical protein
MALLSRSGVENWLVIQGGCGNVSLYGQSSQFCQIWPASIKRINYKGLEREEVQKYRMRRKIEGSRQEEPQPEGDAVGWGDWGQYTFNASLLVQQTGASLWLFQ